jgi:hypothetical protein
MDLSHIAGLLAPFLRHPLNDEQLRQLGAYLDLPYVIRSRSWRAISANRCLRRNTCLPVNPRDR